MNDKKSLCLAVILGLFLVAVGMISFVVFDSVNKHNKVFINNEVQLGDSKCGGWYSNGSEFRNNKTGCGNTCGSYPTDNTTTEYCCVEDTYKKSDCDNIVSQSGKTSCKTACSGGQCYLIKKVKRTCSGSSEKPSTDTKTCAAGEKLVNGNCEKCSNGQWSNGGTATSCTSCPAGYACKDGKKIPCSSNRYSTGGKSECMTCVDQQHIIRENGHNVGCSTTIISDTITCKEGSYLPGQSTKCSDCPAGYACAGGTFKVGDSSSSGIVQCKDKMYSTGSAAKCKTCYGTITKTGNLNTGCKTSNNTSPSTDKCYKDANNDYQVGNFNNQPGYTLVSNETKNCNNIKVKKVDSNKTVLTGATITFTDSSVPPVTRTFNIGETDINMTNPGTYTIVETVAPNGYQIDNTPIQVIVNDDGTINVTGGTNIDLGVSNGTRNITLSIVNSNGNSTPEPTVEEFCYIKRGNGTNNDYCYGNTNTNCVGYSEVVSGRTRENCTEDIACFQKTDGTYTVGKFDGQSGYQYFGTTCPACYEDANGTYRWTNTPNANERPVAEINTIDKCVTPPKSSSKIIYIILIIIVAAALFIVLKSFKKGNNSNNMSTEY